MNWWSTARQPDPVNRPNIAQGEEIRPSTINPKIEEER
jgi:hypothetical protein